MKKLLLVLIILFCFVSAGYGQYKVDPDTQIFILKQQIEILKLKLKLANMKAPESPTDVMDEMAGTGASAKLSSLTELAAAPAESDELYINDGGTSKKITVLNLMGALESELTSFEIHSNNLDSDLTSIAALVTTAYGRGFLVLDNEAALQALITTPWADADIADAHSHAADAIDAITEIAAALKSGSDTTIVTGTKGTSGNCAEWNADGDLVGSGDVCGGAVTVSDDESTDDDHEVVFTTDNTNLESDGDFNYNPSTGLLSVPSVSTSGVAAPTILGKDSDDATGEFSIYGTSSGGTNAIVFSLGVEESDGSNADYVDLDGVNKQVEFKKPAVAEQGMGIEITELDSSGVSEINLSATDCSGIFRWYNDDNDGDISINLPAESVCGTPNSGTTVYGKDFTFYHDDSTAGDDMIIQPAGSDYIKYEGTSCGAGMYLLCESEGASVRLVGYDISGSANDAWVVVQTSFAEGETLFCECETP